ncbi:acyl-coenzyme A thioesterase PaaI-like protein [Ectopseudomonas oleovorans]|uniref:Acyl-coenzyme A thioesterase PaaI-like protein n=1 Tax=Ectopseudomonas oleovorans TaxID=301 RepID=A0A397NKT6_ECTOL|nr:hotdog fold domain-containing protein [Pseudomonas oleovorans]RIA35837.1 acyl-coenzyme A thioesterase PaaI-like protein [Pseudomonas oleovorans]
MSQMLQMFQQAGAAQFSAMIGQVAPYFASIAPQMVELRPGYAEVSFAKRREVLNHIGTVHAIALCNAAELAAGSMTDASIPAGCRWIPKGMTVEYLAKADGDIRTVADGSQVDWSQTGDIKVPVMAYAGDKPVFRAEITMYVSQA